MDGSGDAISKAADDFTGVAGDFDEVTVGLIGDFNALFTDDLPADAEVVALSALCFLSIAAAASTSSVDRILAITHSLLLSVTAGSDSCK